MAGAVVNPEARIGEGVIVNTCAVVEHDVVVGDYAHIAPNAVMGGGSRLGPFSRLSLGETVLQCVSIGSYTIVGAGGVAVKDLPDHVVAIGVPAQIHRCIPNESLIEDGVICNSATSLMVDALAIEGGQSIRKVSLCPLAFL